jgi:hypothetical protein
MSLGLDSKCWRTATTNDDPQLRPIKVLAHDHEAGKRAVLGDFPECYR